MSSVSDEFASFSQFAQTRLQSEPVESLEELVDLWRFEQPSDEEQDDVHAAIREGLEDLKAGRYRPVEVVMEELRAKYSLPE